MSCQWGAGKERRCPVPSVGERARRGAHPEMKGVGRGGKARRGDRERRHGEEGREGGVQERQNPAWTVTSRFPTSLLWHKLLRGLFPYRLECYSIWFLCIYPRELFVLMSVSSSSLPASSPNSQPALLEAQSGRIPGRVQDTPTKRENKRSRERWGALAAGEARARHLPRQHVPQCPGLGSSLRG